MTGWKLPELNARKITGSYGPFSSKSGVMTLEGMYFDNIISHQYRGFQDPIKNIFFFFPANVSPLRVFTWWTSGARFVTLGPGTGDGWEQRLRVGQQTHHPGRHGFADAQRAPGRRLGDVWNDGKDVIIHIGIDVNMNIWVLRLILHWY